MDIIVKSVIENTILSKIITKFIDKSTDIAKSSVNSLCERIIKILNKNQKISEEDFIKKIEDDLPNQTIKNLLKFLQEEKIIEIENNVYKNISVSSYNQSGGITAGILNVGKPTRILSQNLQNNLLNMIDKDKFIEIMATVGDNEAYELGEQIKLFLINKKYNVTKQVGSIMQCPPLKKGISINKSENTIYVGPQ